MNTPRSLDRLPADVQKHIQQIRYESAKHRSQRNALREELARVTAELAEARAIAAALAATINQ
jgi:hypothetical protein